MKILKIKDENHNDLKNHLKDSSVFMQSYVEYILNNAIKKGIIYAMQEKINELSNYVYLEESKTYKGKRILLKHGKNKKTNFKYFKLVPNDQESFKKYFNNLIQYNNIIDNIELYFNLPKYNNVKNPKVKPKELKGVLKFLGMSRIDNNVQFELLENIQENVEDLLNTEVDGQFQLSVDCKIEDHTFNIEDHIADFSRSEFDDSFAEEIILNIVHEKFELIKHKEYDIKDFSETFFNYIKKNAILSTDLSTQKIFYSDNDGKIKLTSKIISLSHLILEGTRIGPATHCIIPSWMTENVMDVNIKTDQTDQTLRPVGLLAGINVFECDDINDVYVYRTGEHNLKLLYSFDKCNVDEIYQGFINDTDCSIYKIKILKEYNANHINKFLEDKLGDLKFLNIDNSYSPYSLEPFTTIINNPNIEDLKHLGINYNTSVESMLFRTVHQELVKHIISIDDKKSKELKFFGNEDYKTITEMFDNTFETYCRYNDTSIITNGKIGAVLKDLSKFNPVKTNQLKTGASLYLIGHYNDNPIYVDPYMLYNDDRMFMMNDIQLKYSNGGILVSAYKNEDQTEITLSYKLLKDIITINVIDNNYLM